MKGSLLLVERIAVQVLCQDLYFRWELRNSGSLTCKWLLDQSLLAQWSGGFGERWSNSKELGVVTGGFVGQTCCLGSE